MWRGPWHVWGAARGQFGCSGVDRRRWGQRSGGTRVSQDGEPPRPWGGCWWWLEMRSHFQMRPPRASSCRIVQLPLLLSSLCLGFGGRDQTTRQGVLTSHDWEVGDAFFLLKYSWHWDWWRYNHDQSQAPPWGTISILFEECSFLFLNISSVWPGSCSWKASLVPHPRSFRLQMPQEARRLFLLMHGQVRVEMRHPSCWSAPEICQMHTGVGVQSPWHQGP